MMGPNAKLQELFKRFESPHAGVQHEGGPWQSIGAIVAS